MKILTRRRLPLRPSMMILLGVAVTTLGIQADCGGPPFNAYDPPPTFAFKYKAATPDVQSRWAGSSLYGGFQHDIPLNPRGYEPTGFTGAWGDPAYGTFVTFGSWTTVQGGRWPANWRFAALSGCGAGTNAGVDILDKTIEFVCTPRPLISVQPGSYQGNNPPGSLALYIDPAYLPAGALTTFSIVNYDTQSLISQQDVYAGYGVTYINAPALYDGHYYVLGEYDPGQPIEGLQGDFEVYGNPPGPAPGEQILASSQTLWPDQSSSALGYTLIYQLDGNFVLYNGSTPIWATMTNGSSPGRAVMQDDGNLVVYDGNGTPLWNTGTWGHSGAHLQVTSSGVLQVLDPGGGLLWSSQ